mmetsp:Transcript_23826/g.36683  ORF Transcript_23826/g.36683 Transcript_23826/m.36683 type:complete len:88 (-) Transcript_23826:1816-2079(-)
MNNAAAFTDMGFEEKTNSWALLALAVENVIQDDRDASSGWNKGGCGAFGRELVAKILRVHEASRDVQMLASIVCVLTMNDKKGRISR